MRYTIELDPTMYLTDNGMGGCVFFNDTDDGFEFDMTWDDLIENEFEMQTIPGHDGDVLTLDGVQEVHELATALEVAAQKMRKRLEESLVLDRDAWLESNDGKFNQENRHEFLSYFSYDIIEGREN